MTKQIQGVPESFTREQYVSLFQAVGLEPQNILRMSFDADGVRATVFEIDKDGQKVLTSEGWAKHDIYIPVDPSKDDAK